MALTTVEGKPAHDGTVQHLAFSHNDPNWLVSTGDDGRVRGWNLEGRCLAAQSKVQKARMYGVALRPETGLVATAGADGIVRLFSLQKTNCRLPRQANKAREEAPENDVIPAGELRGHVEEIYAVTFTPDGDRLVSAGVDRSLRFWEPRAGGASIGQLRDVGNAMDPGPALAASITTLAISSDSGLIAAGDDRGQVRVWRAPPEDGSQTKPPPAHRWQAHVGGEVRALLSLPEGKGGWLVSAGDDGSIERWNVDGSAGVGVRGFKPAHTAPAAQLRDIVALARAPDGAHVAAGWRDGTVQIWDTQTGQPVRTSMPPPEVLPRRQLITLGFTGDGSHVAVSSAGEDFIENALVPVDPLDPVLRPKLIDHREKVIGFANGGALNRWLASADASGQLLTWKSDAKRSVATTRGRQGAMRRLTMCCAVRVSTYSA